MSDGLRLRTFGALVLERERTDASPEVVYRAGKLLALLLHLSTQRGTPLPRVAVADLLWGDEAPERARASLRQAINSLTRLLGAAALEVTRTTVMLRRDAVPTDRERFLAALPRLGDASDADGVAARLEFLALYAGPFVADEPRVSEAFDGWVLAERQRLRSEFLQAAAVQGEGALARAAGEEMLRVAAIVRAAEPAEALWAELAFDAHALLGDGAAARRAVEEWRAQRPSPQDPLPTGLSTRLERARRELARTSAVVMPEVDATALGGVGTSFVGRHALLERLTARAERARRGQSARVLISGPSGVGKSRMLDEFEARLRLRGARVIRTRLLPAMRDVPFAALADVTRALAALPGALGVTEVSAAALIAFLPELRGRYPVSPASAIDEGDLVRRRIEAFLDLLGGVAEDRFVALIVDDAQHLDVRSRQALEQLSLLPDAKALVLLAARPPVAIDVTAMEVIEVPAFGEAEVRALLSAVAPWPEEDWATALVGLITARTLGLPQQVIEVLRVAEATGLLSRGAAGWATPDPTGVVQRLEAVRDAGEVMATLPVAPRALLQMLRVWGRATPEETLLGAVARLDPDVTEDAWREGLRTLESLGFTLAGWNTWSIAHDSVGESIDARLTAAHRAAALGAIVRHLLDGDALAPALLDHIALLCGQLDQLPLLREVVAEVTRRDAWRRERIGARRFCRQVASAAGRPAWEGSLYRRLGWVARQSRTALGWYVALLSSVALALVTLTVMVWPRLVVEVDPMGEDLGPGISGDPGRERVVVLYVQPRLSVQNAFGRRYPGLSGTVRVRTPYGELKGDTIATLTDGVVQFEELGMLYHRFGDIPEEGRTPVLRFSASGLIWRSRPVVVRGAKIGATTAFRLLRSKVNGILVDPELPVRVMVGDSVRMQLTFEYTTTGAASNYVVAATPDWMPAREAAIRVAGLPRPVQDAWQTVQLTLPPPPPGRRRLIIASGAEDSAEHLMSATNWTVGLPVWGDGNDLAEIDEAQIQVLRRTGRLTIPNYLARSYVGQRAQIKFGEEELVNVWVPEPVYRDFTILGDVIEFDVRPRSTSAR